MRIDLPFGIDELDKLFQVSDFLDNREALVGKFRPAVHNYISKRERLKPGRQRQAHQAAFPDFVITLIKGELRDHFDLNPEELLLLTERDLIDLLTQGYFFTEENY